MSYSLSVAPKARAALATLDPWLAEETLDEIEKLLDDPRAFLVPAKGATAVHDFVRQSGRETHYIFLTIRLDMFHESLEVLSLGHVQR